jgi:predicted small lipoprotein YifL
MRFGLIPEKTWGIIVILFLLLEGCGHKGPLKLPAPQAQTPQAQTPQAQTHQSQTSGPQIPDPQKPDLQPSQQIK